MSTSEEQGWVPATYLEAQNGTRDDSDINTSKSGEGKGLQVVRGADNEAGSGSWLPPGSPGMGARPIPGPRNEHNSWRQLSHSSP